VRWSTHIRLPLRLHRPRATWRKWHARGGCLARAGNNRNERNDGKWARWAATWRSVAPNLGSGTVALGSFRYPLVRCPDSKKWLLISWPHPGCFRRFPGALSHAISVPRSCRPGRPRTHRPPSTPSAPRCLALHPCAPPFGPYSLPQAPPVKPYQRAQLRAATEKTLSRTTLVFTNAFPWPGIRHGPPRMPATPPSASSSRA